MYGFRLSIMSNSSILFSNSSVRVEHDSDLGSHCSGGKVFSESSSDLTIVAMSSGDYTPWYSVFGVISDGLAFPDVCDLLAKVEAGVFSLINSLDSEQGSVLVLDGLSSLETSENSLLVKPINANNVNQVYMD